MYYDINAYEINLNEKYEELYSSLLFDCVSIIFIYDVTNLQSYNKLIEVMKKVCQKDKKFLPKYLLANKIDEDEELNFNLEEDKIFWKKQENLQFYDISAKMKVNLPSFMLLFLNVIKPSEENNINKEFTVYENDKGNINNLINLKTVYKIILLGDGDVGKSSFFNRYFCDDFKDNNIFTMGVCDRHKYIKINGNEIKLQIWDTAGQERFRSLPRKYYQHADGIILIYDVTNRASFNNVTNWIKDISDNTNKKIITYLIGNKIDLIETRKISFQEALELSVGRNLNVLEVSCKLDINVTEIIYKLVNNIFRDSPISKSLNNFSITKDYQKNKSRSCCS